MNTNALDAIAWVFVSAGLLGLCFWFSLKTDRCTQAEKGLQRVLEIRGSKVEQCDGETWQPYRNSNP